MKNGLIFGIAFSFCVASALASGLPKQSFQTILKALQDSSAEVRIAAAEAIAQMPDDDAARPLETALVASADAKEQEALAAALLAVKDKATAKRLSDALANPQFSWGAGAKARAVELVGKLGGTKMLKWLTELANSDQEAGVRAAAIRALGLIGAPPKKTTKD
jgi:HEAT repeat protein